MTGRGPYVRAMADHGPGRVEHYPAAAAVRMPIVVKCSIDDCPSAIAMPPGTPSQGQRLRLEVAGWSGGLTEPVCGGDHCPAPEPIVVAAWTRWAGLAVIYCLALSGCLGLAETFAAPPIVYAITAVLVTAAAAGYALTRGRRR